VRPIDISKYFLEMEDLVNQCKFKEVGGLKNARKFIKDKQKRK